MPHRRGGRSHPLRHHHPRTISENGGIRAAPAICRVPVRSARGRRKPAVDFVAGARIVRT